MIKLTFFSLLLLALQQPNITLPEIPDSYEARTLTLDGTTFSFRGPQELVIERGKINNEMGLVDKITFRLGESSFALVPTSKPYPMVKRIITGMARSAAKQYDGEFEIYYEDENSIFCKLTAFSGSGDQLKKSIGYNFLNGLEKGEKKFTLSGNGIFANPIADKEVALKLFVIAQTVEVAE